MTNHQEEQELELEALESIYPEEFSLISSDPSCFQVAIACEPEKAEDEDCRVSATLQFTYVDLYPDDAPVIEVLSHQGMESTDTEELREFLESEAQENLGMAMVFTIVSAAQERLNEYMEKLKNRKEDEKLRKEKEAEDCERLKFTGTPVTVETFIAWRTAFLQEMIERKTVKEETTKGKLTGRQLFECDTSMENSDAAFLEGEAVQVDESLFQEMDDLDLDEEDLE